MSVQESFSQQPLADIVPSYLYFQYSDDDSLQAFVSAYNQITQSYLDWFNSTPLAIYAPTYSVGGFVQWQNAEGQDVNWFSLFGNVDFFGQGKTITGVGISGALLDWIGQSLYGYARPLLITNAITGDERGGCGWAICGAAPVSIRTAKTVAGTAVLVNDDIYKRALTWHLYLGDGKQMTIQWLKRRIARFLYGANGSDVSIDQQQNVNIAFTNTRRVVGFCGAALCGGSAIGVLRRLSTTNKKMVITLPNLPISSTLAQLLSGGFLAMPFQLKYQVNIL